MGKSVSRALGGGSGIGTIIGLAAAIAIPFAAPAIATAIFGSTLVGTALAATSTVIGAGLGAAGGALSGSMTGNMGRGALFGGAGGAVGGFLGGAAAPGGIFGAPATAAPVAGTGAVAPTPGVEVAGAAQGGMGGASGAMAPGAEVAGATQGGATSGIGGASAPAVNAPSIANMSAEAAMSSLPSTPTAATTGVGPQTWGERFVSGFSPAPVAGKPAAPSFFTAEGLGAAASRGVDSLTSPSAIAGIGQLALTMYNKPPEGLTAQERAYLNETAEMASTNRATYEERVNAARRLLNQGTPNPEQAYAQGSLSYQRRAREAGLRSPEDMRRTMIDATRAGASAVPAEYNRSYEATRAGLAAMPTSVPRGMESYGLEVQRDLERRQREYQASLAQAGGTLVGAFGGQRNKGLFA